VSVNAGQPSKPSAISPEVPTVDPEPVGLGRAAAFCRTHDRSLRLLALPTVYFLVAHVLPPPAAVTPSGWRMTGIFVATIAGLMIQPLPGSVIVLIGLMMFVLVGRLPMTEALSGYSSGSVWLVLAAMMMSRVLSDTGLARRVALLFVRQFGRSSLGVSYALLMTDVTLASGIPSITARSAGIVLPVTRRIAELYDSKPGATANRLGRFLMAGLYQGSAVACAMFLTGQASNVLAVALAAQYADVTITWSSWLVAGLVPGLASYVLVPYGVYKVLAPEIRSTPGAAAYARGELARMGTLSKRERISLAVFASIILLWMTSQWHARLIGMSLDVTLVAFLGLAVLLVTDVLSWSDALGEKNAWDVFVWYGGLLTMGEVLNKTGSTSALAAWFGSWFGGWAWFPVLMATIVFYFYAHYAFASITAHMLAMFPPFVVMLIGIGAPPVLVVYTLACLANLTAGLTHYGTTTAPIVFAEGYVTQRDWWRVGFLISIVNIAVWTTIGFAWWKLLGFW
jgi:DASS family divalent anion:Na+ symporter